MKEKETLTTKFSPGQGIIVPPPALRNYVKYFWYYHPGLMDRASSQFRIIPSGSPGLIFQHENGHASVKLLNGTPYPVAFVHGQDTKACVNVDSGNASLVSVRLHPAAIKILFDIDANEATDQVIPLNDLAGFNLAEQLINAKDIFASIDLIADFLLSKVNESRFRDLLIEQAVMHIINNLSSASSREISKNLHLSQRHFQRKFKEYVGVPPGTYIHILKFQKSINLIQRSQFEKLSDVAYESGYADQSHFIREFKNFFGSTPKEAYKILCRSQHSSPQILRDKIRMLRFIYN